MKFRSSITMAALCLLAAATHAATIVVPAAGTGPGANNSQWQSELTLHSAAPRAVSTSITFHQGTSVHGPVSVTLTPRQTISIADIARTKFGLESGSGALVLEVPDRDAKHLAVTSRTSNISAAGELGQDIPAVRVTDAAVAGDIAAIPGPSNSTTSRFNFGLYATSATTVKWQLLRADGTIASTKDTTYLAGEHAQYGYGVSTFLGAEPKDNDTVHGRVTAGSAIFYGSSINTIGDPTFIPAARTRDDILINFLGVDLNEDGIVDIRDSDNDGRLDGTIEIFNIGYPNYFRVVAAGEFGETVQLELVSAPDDTFVDPQGTVVAAGSSLQAGKTGVIVLKATASSTSALLTIPVRYR